MIVGELRELGVDPRDIEMTDWEVSEHEDFSTILVKSLNDKKNRTSIIFDDVKVKVGKKYYGRARIFVKDMGWNNINNMDIFVRDAGDDVIVKNALPTILPAPKIFIQKDKKNIPLHEVPHIGFNIVLENQNIIGDNYIEPFSYSYYILDHYGHVVHKVEKTTAKEILIEDGLLEAHRTYSIKCCVIDNIGEVSPLGSIVIATIPALKDEAIASIVHGFTERDYKKEITIKIPIDLDTSYLTVEIVLSRNGTNVTMHKQTIYKDDPYLRVPANTLTHGVFYIANVTRGDKVSAGSFQAL